MPQIPARPDLQTLLLEAIRRRDGGATRRLTGQWVHRRGVASLGAFRTTTLIDQQGPEASHWLQEHLEPSVAVVQAPSAPPAQAPPAPLVQAPPASAVQALQALVVDEAFASLTEAFPSLSLVPEETPAVIPAPIEAIEPRLEEAPSSPAVAPMAASLTPIQGAAAAPAPSTLADLRAWLSGGDQHRRAS